MKLLVLIPARAGSKGVPNKNRKLLNGKPLLFYSIEAARKIVSDDLICVSTDDAKIISLCKNLSLNIPFKRPAYLASDTASSNAVIEHALAFYASKNKLADAVILLQPTSPFRTAQHIKEALKLYTGKEDMIISVKETKANPYFTLMEENKNGYLFKSKKIKSEVSRRQDSPPVYEVNGAVYIINVKSFLQKKSLAAFTKVKKYLMNELDSLDIDTPLDWDIAELMMQKKSK